MPNQPPADLRERVFVFATRVVDFCADFSRQSSQTRQIADQLSAAATSVGSNLEQAKAAFSRRDFAGKNSIALKEMREALYWLRLICSSNLAPLAVVEPLLDEARQLTAMLTAGMKKLRPVRRKNLEVKS